MTTMITEVYDALLDAGASEEKARNAAEAIADHQGDIKEIKFKLNFLLILVVPMFLAIFGKFLAALI